MSTTTRTPDLQLAAALWTALGHRPAIEGTGRRKVFAFPGAPDTASDDYYAGLLRVEPRALFDRYWQLRQLTAMTDDDGGRHHHGPRSHHHTGPR